MNRIAAVWDYADAWGRVSLIALLVAAVAQGIFVLVYATRPWRRVRIGRALMFKSGTLAVLLNLTLLNTFVAYPLKRQITTLGICAVAAAVCYQLTVLLTTPVYDNGEPESEAEEPAPLPTP